MLINTLIEVPQKNSEESGAMKQPSIIGKFIFENKLDFDKLHTRVKVFLTHKTFNEFNTRQEDLR